MRRAARRDGNEPFVIAALEAAGCQVLQLSIKGAPDLLVLRYGQLTLIEIKDGAKALSRQKLTSHQATWHARWRDAPLAILRSVEDALRWLRSTPG